MHSDRYLAVSSIPIGSEWLSSNWDRYERIDHETHKNCDAGIMCDTNCERTGVVAKPGVRCNRGHASRNVGK